MENLGRSSERQLPDKDRTYLDSCNLYNRAEGIYRVLIDKGESLEIESHTVHVGNQDVEDFTIYCSKEKVPEFRSIVSLLKLSPQWQLLESARSAGTVFSQETMRMLNAIVSAGNLSDNAKMLFDRNYPVQASRIPLLYTPLAVSKEVKNNIVRIAKQSEKGREPDVRSSLLRSVRLGSPQETHKKSKEGRKPLLSRFFKRDSSGRIGIIFDRQLIEQAYDDLINRVSARNFLSQCQLYLPRRDELIRNDFMDPSLLLMEDLENRGYGIHLFRIAAPSGAYRETVDGLDDCIVVLVDQEGRKVLDELTEPMSIINELYRGRGILYSRYIDSADSWTRFGFSEKEKNRLIAFARLKEVSDEESNFALHKKTSSLQDREHWEKTRADVRKLNVESADQIFLRDVISRLVDRKLDARKN